MGKITIPVLLHHQFLQLAKPQVHVTPHQGLEPETINKF